jgi:hypothetical protein
LNTSTLLRIGVACALLLHPVCRLTAQDIPPPQNKPALLQELDKIASGSDALTQKRRAEAISRLQTGSSSGSAAVELYVSAMENTKYRDNHQDFIDWRQKKQNELHHTSFQNAAQLQLRYILLGLQRSTQKTALMQVPEFLEYLNSLASLHFLEEGFAPTRTQKGARGAVQAPSPPSDKVIPEALSLIRQPATKSSVVEWLQIDDLLPGKDFESSAGNFEGILEKNVKTPLRGTNDTRLPGAWDFQITTEAAVANAANSQQQTETFRNERLPELIFGKLKDTAAIGQPNRALTEMMTLIRTYPSNSSVDVWITTARGLLTNRPAAPTPAATPQPATTNAPATPATETPSATPSAPSTNSPVAP